MMYGGIHVFALWILVMYAKSEQSWAQNSDNGANGGGYSARDGGVKGSSNQSAIQLCSEAGNCTCSFEKFRVTVKCTSARDKLDEIASKLPQTTTHLILRNNGIFNLMALVVLRNFKRLQELDLRDNFITTPGSTRVEHVLGRLSKVLLENNPLTCDCGITRSLWTANITGTCAHPPHLRGVEVNSLYSEDFKCAKSCAMLFTHGRRTTGFYNIHISDIVTPLGNQSFIRAWCDMHGPNGGWILLQQSNNATFNLFRNWSSYENGFGNPSFGYWLGNRYMHAMTFSRRHVLRIGIPDYFKKGRPLFGEYDDFKVMSPSTGYVLQVGNFRGTMADILSPVNNSAFSTYDRDNDKVDGSCAVKNKGAWWYGKNCYIPGLNEMVDFVRTSMKAKEHLGDNCVSKDFTGRIECGWPNITEEDCLARDCCYDNKIINTRVICFIKPHLVYLQRIGCFSVKSRRILEHLDPSLEIVNACRSLAWSRGLILFAVRNGRECLVDKRFPFILPKLNASNGCQRGRGGKNVSDVYRLAIFSTRLTGLSISEVTFKSVRVDWNPVPEPFILGYSVVVQNLPFNELVVPWNRTYASVGGLRGDTTYIISVKPLHGATLKNIPGEDEKSIIITTKPEPVPSRAPGLVTAHKLSSTSLEVKWSPLPREHFRGHPFGFAITYYPLDLKGHIDFLSVNHTTSTITLTNLRVYTMYIINVSAVSHGGMGPAKIAKAQTGPAAPLLAPDLVIAYNSSSTSLIVKWSHLSMKNFQGEPIGYNINYQSINVESGINFARVKHKTNITTLNNLTVYTMYVINLSAVSSGGIGPASTAKARTDAAAPSHAPDLLTAYNSSSTSLVVKWSRLPKKHFQGEPIGYQIVYYPVDAEGGHNSVRVNYTTSTTTLINMTVYTMYAINVSAVSSGGIGPRRIAHGQTGAEAPLRAPEMVTTLNSSSTTLVVKWSHLQDKDFRGKPIGYDIMYGTVNLETDTNFLRVNHATNDKELTNLTPLTIYVIYVSAVSSGGIGPANTTKAKTKAGAPSRAPDLVTIQNYSSSSLTVKWSRLLKKDFHGPPIGYIITYYPVDLKGDIKFARVKYTTNTKTLTNLTVYTMYVINVSAVSFGGVGPANIIQARTGSEEPAVAPNMITAFNKSSTSLMVKWSHLAVKNFQGQPIGYRITYYLANLEIVLENDFINVDYPTNGTTLTGLMVYTTYIIEVSAVSSGGIGPENTAMARTGAEAPLRALSLVIVHSSSSTSLFVTWSHLQEEYFQGQPIGYSVTYHPEHLEREVKFWTANYTTNTATLTNLATYTLYTINVSAVSSGGIGPANTVKARTGAEAPSLPPDLVTVHNSSSTSLVVKWTHLPEKDFHGQPIGYSIVYFPTDSGNDINVVSVKFTTNSATLINLIVYTMYVINVSAVSSGGMGPGKAIMVRTDAGAPSRYPDSVTAQNSSSMSLNVKWNHLPQEHFNGQPFGYNVIYYAGSLESDIQTQSIKYTTNTTTLSNLTVYTMYVINVSAVSSGGVGPTKMVKARTGAEAPFRAPDVVTVHISSSTSLVVEWTHLPEENFQGQPIGYSITYFSTDSDNDINAVSVNFKINSTTLINLTFYTVYVINVSAESSGGIGPANTVKARTDAAAPSRAPDLVIAQSSSSTSLHLKWSHLPKEYFNGQLIGYNVSYYPFDTECCTNFMIVNFTTNITTLTNLTVYTMYALNVSAVSSGGIGPAITAQARTDAEAPNLRPDRITAYNTSSTSLIVKWTHVAEEGFQGQQIGYNINYYPDDLESDVHFERVDFVSNTTTLSNLTVYTVYVINVSAVSSGGIGPATTVKARTDAKAPSKAPHLITAYNSSSTSLVVRWSHLPEKHFQGQPIGYRITFYSDESESDTKVMRLNYKKNTTTLTNLTVYTTYLINVSAVSSGGIGPANKAKARTDAGVPVRAPGLVIVYNTSSTTLIVKWSHLQRKDFQGKPIGYKISYHSFSPVSNINYVSVNYTTNTTTLTNLTVYTIYVIAVSAVSSGGIGATNTIKVPTDAGAPSRSPDLVTAQNSSSRSLNVEWSHLPEEHFQGEPIGYNVIYYPISLESDINFLSVNFRTNTTSLTNLTVYTIYVINVSAISSGGKGPANSVKARTDAEVPSLAPDQVIAHNTSSTSLKVEWSHVGEERFQGQPIGYNIIYYADELGSDVNFMRVNFLSNATTLRNLTVYTIYVINVSAVSSGGIGPLKTVKARTGAAAPSLAPHFIVACNASSSSLLVEWSHLVEEQFQGQPFSYHIRYHSRLLGRKSEQFVRVNFQTNTTTLTKLAVYTVYVIFVSAVSSGGMGPENMAEARTGIEAPFQAPALVIAHNSSSTNLLIKWSHLPEDDFQGEPIGYLITHHPIDLESNLKFMFVNYMTNTTTLTNLTVYTMYVINVSAVSSGGTGPAKTVKTRTGAEAPSRAPDKVTAQDSSSTSLIVKWSHLAEKQFQGQPTGYNVAFYPLNLENEVTLVSLNCTTNTRTLTNLTIYTMYVINVSAVSSGGIGPANTVKAQTDAEVPFRGPYSVIAYNYSSTSLAVKWRHLLKEDFQGKPIGYKITYYPIDSGNDIISLSVNYTTNITTLTNLTVYTMYIINVSAVSSGGIGPANTAKGRTGAEVPSVAPSQVLVTAESSKSLHVSWTAVPPEYRHGKIHMHKIYVNLATQPSKYIATYFAFNPVEYNITDLRVYTLYVICVSAVNEAGEGPKSEAVTARTLESVPSAPPRNLSLVRSDSWFVVVEWKPVPEGYENGVIKGYRLVYGVKDSRNFVFVSDESIYFENTVVLSGLDFDTLYSIRVAAFTSVGSGNFSESIEVRTKMFDPCKEVFCSNGGTCILTPESYINASKPCICQKQFVGRFCDTYVAERSCRSPTVKLPSLSPNVTSFLTVRRANELVISSEVNLDCDLSYETIFNWEVYDLHWKSRKEPALSRYGGSSEFLIKRSKLRVGIYLVRLTVKMAGTQVFGFSEGYIRVVESPLVAHIAGGTKVERGFNKTLVLNASLSLDPDSFQPPHGLRFTWVCRDSSQKFSDDLLEMPVALPSPSEASSDRGGCYGTGAGNIGGNDSIVRIESGHMTENSSYFITVVVDKHPKRAYFTQEVVISPGDPSEVEIRCEDNCDFRVNPSRRLALERLCEKADCERGLCYHWTLFEVDAANGSKWIQVSDLQEKIRTRLTSPRIVTKLGVLEPNKIYKFVLTAKRRGGHSGYSEYKFVTYGSPTEGKCDVTPLFGKTLETTFTFACSGWKDPDGLLQYSLVYFTDDDFTNVVYKGMESSKRTKLPAGKKINNFTIDFRVRVADMFGAFTEVRTPVQVLQLQIDAEKLVDRAVRLITGNQSQLNNLIQSGDVSQAVQLAKAAILAVDVDEKIPQDQLKEKRKTVKSSIVKQLSAVQVETVERIQQTSNVIAEAVSVVNEVTVEAQIAAVDTLQSMTKILKEESLAGKSFEALLDGARSLAAGLGGMLKVSSYGAREYDALDTHQLDLENLYRQRRNIRSLDPAVQPRSKRVSSAELLQAKNESKKRTLGLLKSLDNVGRTILSRTLVGEMPRELSSHSVSLLLFREEPNLFSGSVLSNQGYSFTLPSDSNLFGNGTRFVDSQIITTSFVSYSWHPSAARLTSRISSLELKNSSGHHLKMSELTTPMIIKLRNYHNLINTSQSYSVGARNTVFHRINVTNLGMALILKIRPENNKTEFFVTFKFGKRPSYNNSDINDTVPNFSSCAQLSSGYVNCSSDPYKVFVNSKVIKKTGIYFIGIQVQSKSSSRKRRCSGQGRSKRACVQYKETPAADETSTGQSPNDPQFRKGNENYTIQVLPATCLYWNTTMSKWTNDGCKVAETTTMDTIHCHCNHLTAFGGEMFVAPNPIDFDKVFIELQRIPEAGNVAVIVTVTCVFGIYLIIILWVRKADQKDALKIGDKPFLGSLSPWCCRYEIEISTGIWFDSGTSANVYLVLEGELGSSRPYHLKSGSFIPFARGSLTCFTLSIPDNVGHLRRVRVWHDNSGENPSWYLNTINIYDSSSQELKIFICHKWLAVEKADGLIDRTFAADSISGRRNNFWEYLQNRLAEKLSEGHLWFSVATRPPSRHFTRVQRLSCCLSLLLTTMLAGAMFYQFAPGHVQQQHTLRLGPLVLNLRQFIIALESIVVVLPINFLIVGIFSHVATIEAPEQRQRRCKIARRFSIYKVTEQFRYRKGLRMTLPYFFVYFAWFLCFISSAASATFIVLSSLQWGKETSEEWLISIFMSLFVDIFGFEPVKIVVVALFLSFFYHSDAGKLAQTPRTHFDEVTSADGQKKDENEENIALPEPLSRKELRRARLYRMRELRMYKAIQTIVCYSLYLWILMIMCYGGRSQYSHSLKLSLEHTFGEVNKISSHETMWQWLEEVLLPGIYQDGKDLAFSNSTMFTGDGDAVLVGMPRLRQLRVKKDSCQVVKETKSLFNSCIGSYSLEAEDKTQLYQPGWRPLALSPNISAETLNKVCPKPWRYSTAEQTESLPFWGKFYPLYSQGGYLAELGYDRNSAAKVISDLSRLNWFDKYTSAVLIEFTVFNSRISLFSVVWITVEFSPSGYVASGLLIHPLHVYNIGAGYGAAHLVCLILFILFIVYFVFKETKEMIQQPKHYFRRFLNWIELAQVLTAISFAVTHIFKEVELSVNSSKLHENIFQFISFVRVVLLDDVETAFLALLMFFNTLKLLYLFRFNSHVKRLSEVMKASFLGLVNCSVGFYVFVFAFTHFGFIQFGRELKEYSSFSSAFQSLLGQGVLSNKAEHLQDCHDVIGPLFFIVFNMCLQVIWLNIFIAILIHDHKTAAQFFKGRFSLGKFMIRKIKETLHCIRDRKPSPKRLGSNRKKRVHWENENDAVELDNNNNDIGSSKKPECKSQNASSKELDRCITVMSLKLNDLYTDAFIEDIEDIELLNLWVDAFARRRNVCEIRRAGNQSEGVAQARKMKS